VFVPDRDMPTSGRAVASIMDAGPTIREAFHDSLRREHAALISEARYMQDRILGDQRSATLIKQLADALEGKTGTG
jgi:hypothetical protein